MHTRYGNQIALLCSQGATLAAPLLVLPYILRLIDVQVYGHIAYLQLVMALGAIVIEFGYNWSVVERVNNNVVSKSTYFSSVAAVQWIFAITLTGLWLILLLQIGGKFSLLDASSAILLIGAAASPFWLALVTGEIVLYSLCNVATRVCGVIAVFMFVDTPDDIRYLFLSQGLPQVIFGVGFIATVLVRNQLFARDVNAASIVACLKDSFGTFLSRVAIGIYATAIPMLIGVVAGKEQLAIFSVADKIRLVIQAGISPILDLKFARIDQASGTHLGPAHIILSNKWIILVVFLSCAFLFVFAPDVVHLVAGARYPESTKSLRVLCFIPIILVFTYILGINGLYKGGDKRSLNQAFAVGAAVGAAIAPYLITNFDALGAAISALFAEIIVVGIVVFRQTVKPRRLQEKN